MIVKEKMMTNTDEHCGYTNYETFIVAMEVKNIEHLYFKFRSIPDLHDRADGIKNYVESQWDKLPDCNSLAGCLALAASIRVNYRQIAEILVTE